MTAELRQRYLDTATPQWSRPTIDRMTAYPTDVVTLQDVPQWSRPMNGRMTLVPWLMISVSASPQWSRPIVDRMGVLIGRAGEVERLAAMEPTDNVRAAVGVVVAAMEPTGERPDEPGPRGSRGTCRGTGSRARCSLGPAPARSPW
jgi:hypothetical protein